MIPADITAGLTAFQAAFDAAQPITQAPSLQIAALVRQGQVLLTALDAAISAVGAPLDADEPTGYATGLVAAVNAIGGAAQDQRTLSEIRGLLGRAVLNLGQAQI